MLFRQDWVKVHGEVVGGAGRPRTLKARSPRPKGLGGPLPENFEKLIAQNAFSEQFRRFLVTLKEYVIPKKWRGELGSDLKMNQTKQ